MTRGRVVPYEGSPGLSARTRLPAALLLILGLLGTPVGETRAQAPGTPAAVVPLITPPVTRVLYRSHNVVSAGSQENPVTDLMKPGWCRAAFQALQQASMRSSRVSMTRLARKRRRSSCHSSSTGLSSGL